MTSVGKIITANTSVAYCEFNGQVEEDSHLYYLDGDRKVPVRVTYLQVNPRGGMLGHVAVEGLTHKPARAGLELFADPEAQKAEGVRLNLAVDHFDRPVPIRLNAIFRNWMMAGRTQTGKTHLGIAVAEELLPLRVPHLILDLQNEFTGLKQVDDHVVLLDDGEPDPAAVLAHLRDRRTVIVPMLGAGDEEKARRSGALLRHIFDAKEADHVGGKPKLPPILVTIDEAEVLAPSDRVAPGDEQVACRSALQNILKRGSKLGIGCILLPQRLPALFVEIRSQCSSVALFALDDTGSLSQLKLKGLTKYEQDLVGRLPQGHCVLRGPIVPRSTVAKIRAIRTPRTKNVNFEELLNLSAPAEEAEAHVPAPAWMPGSPVAADTTALVKGRHVLTMPQASLATSSAPAAAREFQGAELAKLCVGPRTTDEVRQQLVAAGVDLSPTDVEKRLEQAYRDGLVGKGKRFVEGEAVSLWTAAKPSKARTSKKPATPITALRPDEIAAEAEE